MTGPALRYDEPRLVESLGAVSPSARAVFAAACAERLLPIYRWFHVRTGRGDPDVLQGSLAELWRDLEGLPSHRLETHRAVAEELVPDEDDSWVDECAFAQHAVSAVAYAIRCRLTGAAEEAGWAAREVYEALDLRVTTRDGVDLNAPGAEERVLADPLIQAELARQARDIAELRALDEQGLPAAASRLRQRAASEGWSKVFDFLDFNE